MDNGHHVNFLEGNMGVRLPSIPSGSQSYGEDQRGLVEIVLLAPWWPKRVWSLDLLELSKLPLLRKLLLQPRLNIYHQNLECSGFTPGDYR